jgi:hypothetical protein
MPVTWENFDPNKVPRRYYDFDPAVVKEKEKSTLGGGPSKASYMAVVTSFNAIDNTAKIMTSGGEIDARVAMDGKTLYPGNRVAVVAAKDGDDIIFNRRPSDSVGGTGVKYRVTDGWPKDARLFDLAYGMSFVDEYNAFGFGEGALIIDSDTPNNVYMELTGTTARLSTPPGYTFIARAKQAFGGFGFQWFADSAGAPRLFQRDSSSPTGWTLIPGLPDSRDDRLNGRWDTGTIGKEVRTSPVVGIGRVDGSVYSGSSTTGWYIPMEVRLRTYDPVQGAWTDHVLDDLLKAPVSGSNLTDLPASTTPVTRVWACGKYAFVQIYVQASYATEKKLYLFDPDAPIKFTHVGTTMEEYLNITSSGVVRMSHDGMVYSAFRGFLNRRAIGWGGALESQYAVITSANTSFYQGYPQRDAYGETFFIASLITSAGQGNQVGAVFEHSTATGETVKIIEPMSGDDGGYVPLISMPVQGYDGAIYINMDTEAVSALDPLSGRKHGSDHKVYKLIPAPGSTPEV